MKFKVVFSLIIVLIVLSSIGMVSANENTTESVCEADVGDDDTLQIAEEPCLSKNSDKPVELFVEMSSDCDTYVVQGDTVKWTITVEAEGGTARDTKLYTRFDGAEYLSHNTKVGRYDKNTRLWTIGNLAPNKVVSLTIKTKITQDLGDVIGEALAITSSNKEYKTNEFYFSNYAQDCVFVGDPERSITTFEELVNSIPGNNEHSHVSHDITGSDDIAKYDHQEHYFSSENSKRPSNTKSDNTGSFYKTARAESSYHPYKADTNKTSSESNNSAKLSSASKNYEEPFSIRKVAVYLSEDKLSLAVVVLSLVILIGVVYLKRRD